MTKKHPLEAAKLGKAPFTFIGTDSNTYQACPGAPVQPGGSCDYCGTPIRNQFHFKSSDSKTFKLGSSCCEKGFSGVKGDKAYQDAMDVIKKINTKKRHERENKKIADGLKLIKDKIQQLEQLPHPNKWRAKKGESLANYIDWVFSNAGNAGKIKAIRLVKKSLDA